MTQPMQDNPVERLNAVMKKQREEADHNRMVAIQSQWAQFGEIKDKQLLHRLALSSQEFFDSFLAVHPAKGLWDKVNNVHRAFDILSLSREAFIDLAGKFHARVDHDMLGDDGYDRALSYATKEIYTYSCAAYSLVQAYRHLISGNELF